MSRISRRSLLGYSGSAAAGAVLVAGEQTQAAAATEATEATTAAASEAAVTFPNGAEFHAGASLDLDSSLQLTFSLQIQTDAQHMITPIMIADALNEIAASRGWPALTFYGRPAEAPLT
ncbi:hypothetical protein [Streptomyces sp. NBC_00576]|uniref:hypothetical protein n=1 Tax=Streptomyces sp. NBC_00576 TaxID=2903665 RepID=UPI002E8147A6|nr:hypothetical protein [Streptomyces sp. NBC_00576]WUB76060.1 hypothetical protein OG734_41805 [Streptomyces sp. NBC_00576]